MKVLFDQGTPVPLRRHLHPHVVDTAAELGWSQLRNGDLIARAEASGYEALITTDMNLKYQQNLARSTLRLVVLTSTSWPRIQRQAAEVRVALESLKVGGYREVSIAV